MAKKTPEGKVKDIFMKWIQEAHPNAWVWTTTQTGWGRHGIPDAITCLPQVITQEMVGKRLGVFAAFELKAKGGKTTAHQERELNAIAEASGKAFVVEGEELDTTAYVAQHTEDCT